MCNHGLGLGLGLGLVEVDVVVEGDVVDVVVEVEIVCAGGYIYCILDDIYIYLNIHIV